MMTLFLTYELKVALLIAVFYIFWRLLVANETWHRLNRIVLLSTAIASFVLPLCVITIHQTVEVVPTVADALPLPSDDMTMPMEPAPAMTSAEIEKPFNWQLPLTIIYIIGVVVVLLKILLSLWRLHKMKAESEIHPLADGRQIAVCEKAKTPFSWWKTVFLNHQDFEDGTTALLTHELGHLRLHHSADVLLVELLTALQWFNPTMWMLRADLRTIHEYEADQQVLSHGFNDIQYLQLLIRKAAGQSGYSLANGISNSALKKRVTMIMKPKSNHRQWLRYAYLLPIIATSLYATAQIKVDYTSKEESAVILGEKDGQESIGVKVPVGAFYTWLAKGRLAERSVVKEDGWWNTRGYYPVNDYLITLDGKEIRKDDVPYVPLSSIKEVKLIQGEKSRRIELYTHHVTEFNRDADFDYPAEYKDKVKAWMFFRVEEAATGRQLKGAEITVVETGQKAKTNEEGWCELKVPLGTTVKVSYPDMESAPHRISLFNGNEVKGWTFKMRKANENNLGLHKETEAVDLEKVYDVVEQMPEFSGGHAALFEFLSKNIHYPEEARKNSIQGRVIATFVVEKDGNISNARVVKSVDPSLDAEALRVINSMPNWNPGKQNGKAVRVKYTVPVTFKLDAATPAEKYILEIDGKVADDSEIANIPSGDVVSMDVVPAQNGQPKKIVITTKKKQ
jgi:TonB family protein